MDKDLIHFQKCEIAINKDVDCYLSDTGRLLIVNVSLNHVYKDKMIAVGVLITENRVIKGFKARKIYTGINCPSRFVNCNAGKFIFILPDENLIADRNIDVKIIANYTDLNMCW